MASPKLSPSKAALIDTMLAAGASNSAIQTKVGASYNAIVKRRALGNYLRPSVKPGPKVETAAAPSISESHTKTAETWTISIPETDICTEEQLIAHCKIDLKKWEITECTFNKWGMGYTTGLGDKKRADKIQLFQVTAKCKLRRFTTEHEYVEENTRLRRLNAHLQSSLRTEKQMAGQLARNHAGHDDLLENMGRLVESMGTIRFPVTLVSPPPRTINPFIKSTHTEDAVLLISDTHFGEKSRREDSSGFSGCDAVVLANRTGYVFRAAKEVLSIHRAAYPIKNLIVWYGGDVGNGELHESARSNDLMITEQIHFAYYMLKFGLEDLLALTVPDKKTGIRVIEKIVMLFTVGNHMRLDEKMAYKTQARRTFDWLIYQMLIETFKDPKYKGLIEIRTEMAPFIFENIRGHRYGFCHGNQIGYRNNPSTQVKAVDKFMARTRALFDSPQWRKATNFQGGTFSRMCIGDIHVPLSFPRFKSNASLPGTNELGVNWQLEPVPAGQQIFGVSDKHQETWSYFLDCSHVGRSTQDMNNYGAFAQQYLLEAGK